MYKKGQGTYLFENSIYLILLWVKLFNTNHSNPYFASMTSTDLIGFIGVSI
ncbi:hypothetical protein EMGBS15_09170 [Filimonas sp.]|nr:hypothetical protein EMGBS15_09170 [Filimonas sp.]